EEQEQEKPAMRDDLPHWAERWDPQRIGDAGRKVEQVVAQRLRRDSFQEAPSAKQPDGARRHRSPSAREEPPGRKEERQEDEEENKHDDPGPALDPREGQPCGK